MNVKTTQLRSSYILILLLITAFLAMQWATVHAHLPDKHHHDGTYHQHKAEPHSHSLVSKILGTIDSYHYENHENIVEFDPSSTTSSKQQETKFFILGLPPAPYITKVLFRKEIKDLSLNSVNLTYLSYSTVNLRAPPQLP